jgi:predicted alpha/beta superfamily hydrolase
MEHPKGKVMYSLKIILVVFSLVSISFVSHANTSVKNKKQLITTSKPINYAQQITFDSKVLGKYQVMNIYLPENFEQSSDHHTYPVIFINDSHGSQFFHALTGIVKHLSEVERIPKSIVVSLNDGGHIPDIYINGMWSGMEKIDKYGQPNLYLRHLTEEFFPFLKENYRANDQRTIIGVSGSALFPLDTFVHSPKTFNAYLFLATSDMIGMGFKKGHTMIEAMAESLSQRPDRKEYLYFADADSDFDHDPAYEQNLNKLKNELSAYKNKNFNFDIETFANEDHYASFLKAMLSAFEHMYPQKLWEPKYRELIKQPGDAMANIDAFYQSLSDQYGFEILPNADRWNNVNNLRFISGKLLRDGRSEEAVTVSERWSLYRPQSLTALLTWAQALEKLTLNKQALNKYQQLVLLAKDQESERLSEFKLAMENVQNKMH